MSTAAKCLILFFLLLPALSGQAQPSTQAAEPAAAVTRAELDQMLAPIALYPDTVLTHVLIAATYPLEVVQAHRWRSSRAKLEGDAAVEAASRQDWDPSVQALTAFPDLLQRMHDDLAWTQSLGEAFLADEASVMAAVQDLRQKAYDSGSLAQMQHVAVQREEKIILIEPAVERVVYIPYYDTRVVYGNWWWSNYPPVLWRYPANRVVVGGIYWGPRVYLGSSFFFASMHWHQHRVVWIDRSHVPRRGLYSGRRIVHYEHARHWRHNPAHRRGVVYRHPHLRERYLDHRGHSHRGYDKDRYQRRLDHGHSSRDRALERATREQRSVIRERELHNRQREDSRRVRNTEDGRHSNPQVRRTERVEVPDAVHFNRAKNDQERQWRRETSGSRDARRSRTPDSRPALETRRRQLDEKKSRPSRVERQERSPRAGFAPNSRISPKRNHDSRGSVERQSRSQRNGQARFRIDR